MSPLYKSLAAITTWLLFIFCVISLVIPTSIGIITGALAGTINDIDAGKLWFYRHGLSYLIGFLLLIGHLYAVQVLKSLHETS